VLDAGCGVGGSAIWLAREKGAHVTGITITPHQVDAANKNAQRHKVADKVRFERRDFTATGYPDASFDVVWAWNRCVTPRTRPISCARPIACSSRAAG